MLEDIWYPLTFPTCNQNLLLLSAYLTRTNQSLGLDFVKIQKGS